MHKALNFLTVILLVTLVCASCADNDRYHEQIQGEDYLIAAQAKLTDVIIHDIFSPPVASRIYAYPAIAAFEVAALADPTYESLMGNLRGFEVAAFDISGEIFYPLAALEAYYQVATAMIFSEDMMDEHRENALEKIKSTGIPKEVFNRSLALGSEVANHVISYSKKDNYHQSRSFEKYSISDDPHTWQPTPPAYMEGIEPHWNKIRTFVLDSANQFVIDPPTAFSTAATSQFYEEAHHVYTTVNNLSTEQSNIAYFWDCNPYVVNVKGHVMFAVKKITPGGHWMGIAAIASKTDGRDWKGTTEALAYTSVALFDGFIACWDEKYRSALIRPETYINQYIDEEWLPVLQTPPFPEHTSGHSVISTAASIALTKIFGEPFQFLDSTEVAYGLPDRTFNSFREAAEEAAISRLYGGIHYMPAIAEGVRQGKLVGNLVKEKINTRKSEVADIRK